MPAISEADDPRLLAAIAELVASEDSDRVRAFSNFIRGGVLTPASSVAATQDALELPHPRLGVFTAVLDAMETGNHSPEGVALATDAALAAVSRVRASFPRLEVARTGPSSQTFELRATGAVSREIIGSARSSLLVVGYSVSVRRDQTGLAAETVGAIVEAAMRGVRVTAVLHRDSANREALLRNWPAYARQPVLFTWPESPTDEMTKLHAKVLVADRQDALVTSANLTYHGLEANIELGIRVSGEAAAQVEAHFRDLIRQGELVEWPAA